MVRTGGLLLDAGMFIWRGEGGREEIILFMLYQLKMLRMILKVNLLLYLTEEKRKTNRTDYESSGSLHGSHRNPNYK